MLNPQTTPHIKNGNFKCGEHLRQPGHPCSKRENCKFSQNSQVSQELAVVAVSFKEIAKKKCRFFDSGERSEHLKNSQEQTSVKIT